MKFLIRFTRVHSTTTTRKQGNHGCPGNWYLRPSVDGGRKCFIKVTVLKYSERGSLGEINILRFLGDARYFMYVFFFLLGTSYVFWFNSFYSSARGKCSPDGVTDDSIDRHGSKSSLFLFFPFLFSFFPLSFFTTSIYYWIIAEFLGNLEKMSERKYPSRKS